MLSNIFICCLCGRRDCNCKVVISKGINMWYANVDDQDIRFMAEMLLYNARANICDCDCECNCLEIHEVGMTVDTIKIRTKDKTFYLKVKVSETIENKIYNVPRRFKVKSDSRLAKELGVHGCYGVYCPDFGTYTIFSESRGNDDCTGCPEDSEVEWLD